LKVEKISTHERNENSCFRRSHSHLTPFYTNPRGYTHKLYIFLPASRVPGLYSLSSFRLAWWYPKSTCEHEYIMAVKVIRYFCTIRKRKCGFLLVIKKRWCYFVQFRKYGVLNVEGHQTIHTPPHSHLTPSLGVTPFKFRSEPDLTMVGEVIPECDRQTDGQTP